MALAFCTIVTPDYLPFALTLGESVREWVPGSVLYILVSGEPEEMGGVSLPVADHVNLLTSTDLCCTPLGQEAHDRYHGGNANAYRWASKPSLMTHLLAQDGVTGVIFLDGDMLVTGDCSSLIEETLGASVLLTPHWNDKTPANPPSTFRDWFLFGLYNAGSVGATRAGLPALEWWHRASILDCTFDPSHGVFYDQRYLDLMPLLFDGVKVTSDRRFNVGGWRMDEFFSECGGRWPLPIGEAPVFMHFTRLCYVRLPGPSERALRDYSERLSRNGLPYDFMEAIKTKRASVLLAEERLLRYQRSVWGRVRAALGRMPRNLSPSAPL